MRDKRYVLALDQGTTSSRAIIFNHEGMALEKHQIPFEQSFPRPGWVEHDPETLFMSTLEAARAVMSAAQLEADQIEAIGITNQRETTLLWEKSSGKPVHPAIVWQCRRSASICAELRAAGLSEEVGRKTGLVLDPYFSATKLMWLFREYPELLQRAKRGDLMFGTVDSWLVWRLTGKHCTDPTNASRTMLFNIRKGQWDEELLKEFAIPAAILPTVVPSSSATAYGKVARQFFGVEMAVTAVAGDQQAALFGQACLEPGDVKNTYGTGCFALMNTGAFPVPSAHRLLTTVAWDLGKGYTYALEGSVFVAGAVVQWLRDQLGLIEDARDIEALASSVPDTGGVFFVPAFVGMGAPYWDADARGTLVGLTRGSSKAHIARAALEAIAFQSRDLLVAMEMDFGRPLQSIKADGGASANSFLMQFQADIAGHSVVVPEVQETTALGAAYMAGLATGFWESQEDVQRNWRRKRSFDPALHATSRESLLRQWDSAVRVAAAFKA